MIELEIDGKKITTEPGRTIIEVADNEGIYIPRFCYHKKLSVAANCRMCLVEVEKSGKPLPACATPITAGMKVYTRSPKAITAQRAVMEFLLINHPLDCPICDQGGECELQDLSLGYGQGNSRYQQDKRSVKDKNLGPLVISFMTRCIQCTRCVRFGEEIAGMRELGAYNRGQELEIGTYVQRAMKSELSGNVIDICPVGALVSKPYRFSARAWEMIQHPSIAPHDCIGSNIFIHTRGEEFAPQREVMRVVPRANDAVNEMWLSDRDRFSYAALKSPDRILKPKCKIDGKWREVDWATALDFVATQLNKIIKQHGGNKIGALVSPSSTLEECYLLQKLMRGISSNNIDHRLRQLDFSDQNEAPLYYGFATSLNEIEQLDTILLIGSNTRFDQPLANHRIRKAALQGAKVLALNPIDFNFNFDLDEKIIAHPEAMVNSLAGILRALLPETGNSREVKTLLKDITATKAEQAIAKKLKQGEKVAIFLGNYAWNHPEAATLRALAHLIAAQCQSSINYLTEGANSAGAWIAGAVPHRTTLGKTTKVGLNVVTMLEQKLPAYLLLNVEPELDCADSAAALAAMQAAELVVAMSNFSNPYLENYVTVILPTAPFTETEGSYINAEGLWQKFESTGPCFGEARPAWKILRVLGNQLELDGFNYQHAHEIEHELRAAFPHEKTTEPTWILPEQLSATTQRLTRITDWPIYHCDSLVRRSQPLQETPINTRARIYINSNTASQLNLEVNAPLTAKQNDSEINLPMELDERIPDFCAYIPAGLLETAGFGKANSIIELQKI